ncbi:hypothetical protein EZV62_014822 [Acer yangbiense]|uniref:Reverse transcriptase Ty1/copia-type domain-containing protein n=1 Tax=Acer yangbiense TaxID=1000413 RepID=A0A5C7HU37_9ROSI|nr:hypothetical protein EZV62_014822 [Acer yangbiense]
MYALSYKATKVILGKSNENCYGLDQSFSINYAKQRGAKQEPVNDELIPDHIPPVHVDEMGDIKGDHYDANDAPSDPAGGFEVDDHVVIETQMRRSTRERQPSTSGTESLTSSWRLIDDMLIVGRDTSKIEKLKKDLNNSFTMKDLGPTKFQGDADSGLLAFFEELTRSASIFEDS